MKILNAWILHDNRQKCLNILIIDFSKMCYIVCAHIKFWIYHNDSNIMLTQILYFVQLLHNHQIHFFPGWDCHILSIELKGEYIQYHAYLQALWYNYLLWYTKICYLLNQLFTSPLLSRHLTATRLLYYFVSSGT